MVPDLTPIFSALRGFLGIKARCGQLPSCLFPADAAAVCLLCL
jgi:hypothetical protein